MVGIQDLPVPENPDFDLRITAIKPDDPVHFAQMNGILTRLLTNDAYTKNNIQKQKEIHIITLPASGWNEEAPYIQVIEAEGITENDSPIIALFLPDDANYEGEKAAKKAYSCISRVDTGPGTIRVTCLGKKPITDIQITSKGV